MDPYNLFNLFWVIRNKASLQLKSVDIILKLTFIFQAPHHTWTSYIYAITKICMQQLQLIRCVVLKGISIYIFKEDNWNIFDVLLYVLIYWLHINLYFYFKILLILTPMVVQSLQKLEKSGNKVLVRENLEKSGNFTERAKNGIGNNAFSYWN